MTSPDGASDFDYDVTDQLTAADHDYQTDEDYSYDDNGNRINPGYVTGTNNRLLSDGTYNYDYDGEGNLITRTEIATGARRRFEWDHRNRLATVTDENPSGAPTQRVEFTYDAFNRRIAKSVDTNPLDAVDAAITYFVYDGDDVLLDLVDTDGPSGPAVAQLANRYLHGPAVDQVLAQEDAAGNVQWLLADHLGTIRDILDHTGASLNHIRYDSFGNITAQTDPTIDTRYAFTGREFDPETGLHYYRARYYDAAIGRFLSEDPITFGASDANLYRYVWNCPVMFADSTGLCGDGWEWTPAYTRPSTWQEVEEVYWEYSRWGWSRYQHYAELGFQDLQEIALGGPPPSFDLRDPQLQVWLFGNSINIGSAIWHEGGAILYLLRNTVGTLTDWIPAMYYGLQEKGEDWGWSISEEGYRRELEREIYGE